MSRFLNDFGNKMLTVVGVVSAIALVLLIGNSVLEDRENKRIEAENETIYTTTMGDSTTTTQLEDIHLEGEKFTPLAIPGEYNYIAYSKINGIAYSINTAKQYRWSAKKGFISIKGDVQITADGKLIMCHDEGFTLDQEGKIVLYDKENATVIRSMTEEECLQLRHANTNHAVCSFEEYIKICKEYEKIAFITIRDKYMNELVPEMMTILRKYEMVDRCIVNSFTYDSLKEVRKADSSIRLSYVQLYKTKVSIDDIDDAILLGNCLVCGFNFNASSTVQDVEKAIDVVVITYAKEKGVPIYEAQVHSMKIANKLKEYGIAGAQMMVPPIKD